MTMPRLLEVILTLERGGAQTLLLEKLCYLQAQGYFVVVCAFYDGAMRLAFEKAGIPVHIITPKRFPVMLLPLFLLELYRIRQELAHWLTHYHIDILQTHLLSIYDFIMPGLRKRVSSLKAIVWTFHNTVFEIRRYDRLGVKTVAYRWLYPRAARDVDAIIAVSHGVKQAIKADFGFDAEQITVIKNAILVDRFQGVVNRAEFCTEQHIPESAKIVLTVGRLTEQKGHAYLLDALAMLLKIQPDVYLYLVGEGEDEARLKAQASSLGLQEHVRFLGVQDDVAPFLGCCDVFVLPSLWEGLSQALLEAMAAQKPIVATAVSGTTQLLEDGVSGRVVAPRDADALCLAISDVLANPQLAAGYGQSAYQVVRDDYDISRLGDDYLALYRKLLTTH